jgi:hypothetical protein
LRDKTSGKQSEGSVAMSTAQAAAKPSDCSPDVSERELQKLEIGFAETRLTLFLIYTDAMKTKNTNITITAVYIKKKSSLFLQTSLQALVTPSERYLERNQKVPGRYVVMEPSGFSASVLQRELRELEDRFAETELLCSYGDVGIFCLHCIRVYQEQSNSVSANLSSSSRNSLCETPGEKPEGSMTPDHPRTFWFLQGISQRELRELEGRFTETEMLCS